MEQTETKRVIFLDIDGVLNSHHHVLWQKATGERRPDPADDPAEADIRSMLHQIDPRLAFNLRFVLEQVPDLDVVISSTWRRVYTVDQFNEAFRRLGFKRTYVIGATPVHVPGQKFSQVVPRIRQIECWMNSNRCEWKNDH